MFNSKKGVSPLIATVLLIAFTVALGAVVMNWGKDFVTTKAKDTSGVANLELSCTSDIELLVKKIGATKRLCYNITDTNTTQITFLLENRGVKAIDGVRITVIDDEYGVNSTDLLSPISGGGIASNSVIVNTDKPISQIEFVPMLKPEGETTTRLCSKNALKETDIPDCSDI